MCSLGPTGAFCLWMNDPLQVAELLTEVDTLRELYASPGQQQRRMRSSSGDTEMQLLQR